ncbi:Protein phosphatase 2A regulatory subunit [Spironucleus salmonicida]|uniref:Protein phosphatase 2A regulatory subunit n=1 Tax=Spironucleus salmonicida TaxID=348837 RepID=V6LMS8_9EUKA|nr:Protein phosphatase 2A regulatory subunit [Spironucleus salmonicida]|eukprot:EST45523.1 Protein phosphatase 2A regulatory subunit [Spironucleus salmonicida]
MHTPTRKPKASPKCTPLNAPSPQLILQTAMIEAQNASEHVSQTLTRALASPAASSPFYQLQISEALEQVIDGVQQPLPQERFASPNPQCSPTPQNPTQQDPHRILTSPAPRSPSLMLQNYLPEIDSLDNPLHLENPLQDVSSSQVEEILPLTKRFCFDPTFCGRKALISCENCLKRTLRERELLDLIFQIFPTGITFSDCLDPAAIQAMNPALYAFIIDQKSAISNAFSVPLQNQWGDIYSLVNKSQIDSQNATNDILRATFGLNFANSQVLCPAFFMICEAIFSVPCYFAFSLFPLIRTRYKHLHPNFLSGVEQFISFEETAKSLRIGAENENFHSQKRKILGAQILQFYSDFIAEKPTSERVFNCIRNFNHLKNESPLSSIPGSTKVEKLNFELIFHSFCKFHPGLEFLRATPDFQLIYSETVAIRAVFQSDNQRLGGLVLSDFQRAALHVEFWRLSRVSDVNKMLKFFSYEHFYVIYCQFWQVDSDHDNAISNADMRRYGGLTCPFGFKCVCANQNSNCKCGNVYSSLLIDRAFPEGRKYDFEAFVKFVLCEEDKDQNYAIEYFFALCDLDGDGYINFSDFRAFYDEMVFYSKSHFREVKAAEDMFCQLMDAANHVSASRRGAQKLSLQAIKKSCLAGNFFNAMVNFQKLAQFEVKDPYSIKYVASAPEKCAWDRFCRVMYDLMEEGEGENYGEGDGDGLDGGAFE